MVEEEKDEGNITDDQIAATMNVILGFNCQWSFFFNLNKQSKCLKLSLI